MNKKMKETNSDEYFFSDVRNENPKHEICVKHAALREKDTEKKEKSKMK